ncbi:hypothetical protein ACM26W_02595 [Halomonas sp. HK25]
MRILGISLALWASAAGASANPAPGAAHYYREQGIEIPEPLRAE